MKQRNLLIILVPILILTVLWVISNVYHSHVNSTISLPVATDIIPIQGTFNQDAIERIKARKRIEVLNQINVNISETPSPTPSPGPNLENETSSQSAETDSGNSTDTEE